MRNDKVSACKYYILPYLRGGLHACNHKLLREHILSSYGGLVSRPPMRAARGWLEAIGGLQESPKRVTPWLSTFTVEAISSVAFTQGTPTDTSLSDVNMRARCTTCHQLQRLFFLLSPRYVARARSFLKTALGVISSRSELPCSAFLKRARCAFFMFLDVCCRSSYLRIL